MRKMYESPPSVIESLESFLQEDIRSGDITTQALVPSSRKGSGEIGAKEKTIVAGLKEIRDLARLSDLKHETKVQEGVWVDSGETVITLSGKAVTLLTVERLALNIIMRMSGIATKTRKIVDRIREVNQDVLLAATRKTTPGFRYFEKRAVKIGGGDSHRYALDDMVLIKNNHLVSVESTEQAVLESKKAVSFSKKVSCEVRSLEGALEAAKAGADIILLDNQTPSSVMQICQALDEANLRDKVLLEVSGGITEDNALEYAQCDVDILSSGALTHSYKSADFSMSLKIT
ncbi:MAG: carboxylating nicotinate-nucleotide diphosphorylase [Candidatus Thorarchaeota archaeon]|nr:carboxylating nicotinate-nucleotide diphosphorylase [Candidatus Thorarchaeota archaeon]